MKKILMVVAMLAILLAVVEVKAMGVDNPAIIGMTFLGAATGAPTGALLGGTLGPVIVFSPYLIEWWRYPECRKEPTIDAMARCVQGIKK